MVKKSMVLSGIDSQAHFRGQIFKYIMRDYTLDNDTMVRYDLKFQGLQKSNIVLEHSTCFQVSTSRVPSIPEVTPRGRIR